MKIKHNCIAIIIFLLIPCMVNAATYYVDATNGNDAKDGLSTSTAWKSTEKVSAKIFNAGDSILFKSGERWRGTIAINYTSGTGSNPTTFSSYGSGAKPVIIGSIDAGSSSDWTSLGGYKWSTANGSFPTEANAIYYNTNTVVSRATKVTSTTELNSNWKFYYDAINKKVIIYLDSGNPANSADGIEIPNENYGVYVIAPYGTKYHNLTISNFELKYQKIAAIYAERSGNNIVISNNTISSIGAISSFSIYAGTGIMIYGRASGDVLSINNNTITNTFQDGIWVYATGVSFIDMNGSSINNNYIDNIGATGIAVDRAQNLSIFQNKITNTSKVSMEKHGITLGHCKNVNIYKNSIGHVRDSKNNYLCSCIYIYSSDDNIIAANTTYDSRAGIHFDSADAKVFLVEPTATSRNNKIIYNIAYDCYAGIQIEQENDNVQVLNNLLYNNSAAGFVLSGERAIYSDNVKFQNNISYLNTGESGMNIRAKGNNCVFDYNCYYVGPHPYLLKWLGTLYKFSSFEQYKAASGQDTHSIVMDPKFVNPAGKDFRLLSGSPCINAGINVGLNEDFIGTIVPQGATVDIGAFEFKDIISPPKNLKAVPE